MKDLGKATYILGIMIYRDRSRCLIGLSQSTYLDKVLKKFKMDRAKKGFLLVLLICLQRIYNFLLFHAIIYYVLDV